MYPLAFFPLEGFEITIRDITIFLFGMITLRHEMIKDDEVHFRIVIESGRGLLLVFDVEAVLHPLVQGIILKREIGTAEPGFPVWSESQDLHPFLVGGL